MFITYNSPDEFKNKKNRRTVSSFASRSSRPTSKKIVLGRTLYRPFVERSNESSPNYTASTPGGSESRSEASPQNGETEQALAQVRESTLLKGSVLGSPLVDPFEVYPIHIQPYVPFLVDYCKPHHSFVIPSSQRASQKLHFPIPFRHSASLFSLADSSR